MNSQNFEITFSIIVPTYNRPHLLRRALASLQSQDFTHFEALIINDCGVDVEELCKIDNRFTYWRNNKNLGLAGARNVGLKLAKGRFITYLDDDDILYSNHLSTLLESFNSGYKVVYANSLQAEYSKNSKGEVILKDKTLVYNLDFSLERIITSNFIPVLCLGHARECIAMVGVFDAYLKRMEDWDLFIRLGANYKVHHTDKITSEYAWCNDGTTMTSSSRNSFDWAEINIYYRYLHLAQQRETVATINHQTLEALKRIYNNLTLSLLPTFKAGSCDDMLLQLRFLKERYPNFTYEIDQLLLRLNDVKSCINSRLFF
jgi:glycosyltransferase involved in cell wall biosynthesis